MRVKVPVNYKFGKERIIPEGDGTRLNVAVIIKEHGADNQLWIWTTLGRQVRGCPPALCPCQDTSLLKPYLPLLNAAPWLTRRCRFVWFWL